MSHLVLRLLGGFQATLDGHRITTFESAKARALLAYLATEADRPHRRETLAALLWPEKPDPTANNNFRHTLSALRKTIGDTQNTETPFLLVTRETVHFNCASNCWLDVRAFQAMVPNAGSCSQLADAVALYRGDFLEGFYVRDSAAFEDWALLIRDRLQRQAAMALQRLVEIHEDQGDYEHACAYAWRWVELESWQEEAHQHLMRVLALNGQRTAALAQYDTCRDILQQEFGVDPSAQTVRLYEQIRDDKYGRGAPRPNVVADANTASYPPTPSPDTDMPVFVARERELERLTSYAQEAFKGHGRVVFVKGEAGQGKTMLLRAFAQQAQETLPDLVVAAGNCTAYTGLGDPYLPFRALLRQLTGDVEAQYAAGAITHETALRLWHVFPRTTHALITHGPDLIDTFVPGAPLLERATTFVSGDGQWFARLRNRVKAKDTGGSKSRQDELFEQVTAVLTHIVREAPLVLIIDDMQWADTGSISLLFHLGRHLAGSRILIIGAYRSEEVALGRGDERHPLAPVIHEFQRAWGDITVDLERAEGRRFVEAFLNTEPHRLSAAFQERLYRQTRGHPLFTVELLRSMQERGDVILDDDGRWVEGATLNWDILPVRVEAVIAARVNRLPEFDKQTLRIASVEGEVFTAEIVAELQQANPRDIVAHLSDTLRRRHRLVRAEGIEPLDGQRLSRYRFRHILFQRYFYGTLDHVERAHLHARTGAALEALYDGHTVEIAPQLALHFELAGNLDKAIDYYRQAGERATRMAANTEAVAHLNKALALLGMLPPSLERDERELALQIAITVPLTTLKSWSAPETVRACDRALELSQALGNTQQLLQSMLLRQFAHSTLAEHRAALDLAEQRYNLIQRLKAPVLMAEAHAGLTITNMFVGQFTRSAQHLEQVMPLYDIEAYRDIVALGGMDPGVAALSVGLYSLWYLGYPDQALGASRQALAIAQNLDNPYAMQFLLGFKGRFHRWRHEVEDVRQVAEAEMKIGLDHGIDLAKANAMLELAWVRSEEGYPDEAITMFEEGFALWHAIGMHNHQAEWLSVLAEMHSKAGRPEVGLDLIDEALDFMRSSDERYHEAELYRMRGLLRLQENAAALEDAENDFRDAIDAARRMAARMCELRTTTCLARLWQQQGKREQARQALAEIYGWFTEGFDTLDLREAKLLLDTGLSV